MNKFINKLLGQRKKFNLNISSSESSASEDDLQLAPRHVFNKFNISLVIQEDGSLLINSATSEHCDDTDALGSSFEAPKIRKQRTNSQRSNKSTRTPAITRTDQMDETSDDEAFMNNSANFQKSPRPLRRSLRKKKTSSLKRRQGVQAVPEMDIVPVCEPRRHSVSPLDTTVEDDADLQIEWIENEYYSTDAASSSSGCNVMSERSLIIANAETEDALSDFSDANPAAVFKMPFPVSHRPNICKRKLVVESDEEYIAKTFRGPVKRNCIRYYY